MTHEFQNIENKMEEEEAEVLRSDLCALEIRNGNDLIQELRNRYSKDKIHVRCLLYRLLLYRQIAGQYFYILRTSHHIAMPINFSPVSNRKFGSHFCAIVTDILLFLISTCFMF